MGFVIINFQLIVCQEVCHNLVLPAKLLRQLFWILAPYSIGTVICIAAESTTLMALDGEDAGVQVILQWTIMLVDYLR